MSRLKTAELFVESGGGNLIFADGFETGDTSCWDPGSCLSGGQMASQTYEFDTFGNINQTDTTAGAPTVTRFTPTDPSTNRLAGTATYDAAGNLTSWNGALYEYDRLNKLWQMKNGAEDWLYLYTADDERLWSFKVGGAFSRWTLRGLDGKVLREYTTDAAGWSVSADYIYRDGLLLATESPAGQRHFHLDHLGTPRLVTNAAAAKVAYHVYYPFGEEATAFNQDAERMKFTGHERDLTNLAGPGDDLDYMHARHCSPVTGRFLSVDTGGAKPAAPQSWNRYSYAENSPLKYFDPDGQQTTRAEQMFEHDERELLEGKITQKQFTERLQARGVGALIGAGIVGGYLAAEAGLAAMESATIGASSIGQALTLIGAKLQGVFNFLRNFGEGLTGSAQSSAGRAAVVEKAILTDGSLNVSATVARQLAGLAPGKERSFIPAQAILETILTGARSPDPQKVANQFLYAIEATFNKSQGLLQVIVNEKSGKIVHVLFSSGK